MHRSTTSLHHVGESTKRGYTAPKGRPTRARGDHGSGRRVFGPTMQWIALIAFLALLIIAIWVATDGGDFNPFNDTDAAASPVAVVSPPPGG